MHVIIKPLGEQRKVVRVDSRINSKGADVRDMIIIASPSLRWAFSFPRKEGSFTNPVVLSRKLIAPKLMLNSQTSVPGRASIVLIKPLLLKLPIVPIWMWRK